MIIHGRIPPRARMRRTDDSIHGHSAPWAVGIWMLGPALVVVGLLTNHLTSQLPWERFGLSLVLALLASGLAWPFVRWLRWRWASALALAWAVALVVFAGPRPVLAVVALAVAATALGIRVVPQQMPGRLGISAIAGMAVIGGITGWTLSLPIHHPAVWAVLLAILVATGWRPLVAEVRASHSAYREHVGASPRGTAWAVMLLGLASTGTWLPTMQMDDLTYHLNLPAQLVMQGHYVAAPAHGMWAFSPWLGDILHGVSWLLAGAEARGSLNALWLLSGAAAAAAVMRALRATTEETNAAIALTASFPPLVWLTAGMQTELPAIAALFALGAVVLAGQVRGRLVLGTVLVAMLFALKLAHAFAALPLLAFAAWRARDDVRWARLPSMGILLLLLGGSSYTLAWLHTGNPVFPLLNAVFESPLYPADNFVDNRWNAGFGAALPWQMTFSTSRYVEAWNGGLGFTLVALSDAWLLALRRGSTRVFALVAAGIFVLPLLPLQYARYAYPGILVLIVPCIAGSQADVGRVRSWRWSIVGLCLLNLAFQANAGWTHHAATLKRTIRSLGDSSQVVPHYVAERTLLSLLPDDDGIVLATDPQRGFIAELGGRGRLMSGHDPTLAMARVRADLDPTGLEWRRVMARADARWILVTEATATRGLLQALEAPELVQVRSVEGIALWRRVATAREQD